ncbi:MAG: TrmH family RNA methyltransferase [Bacteroidia bacterium]
MSKARITEIRSLQQKKFRNIEKRFVAEGSKLVLELLDSYFEIDYVVASPEWLANHNKHIPEGIERLQASHSDLERISGLSSPSEVVAVFQIPEYDFDVAEIVKKWSIVLDDIRDPGNLGTIIRIADWFGIDTIICSPESAEVWNPKVVQATMGSIKRVRVFEQNLSEFFEQASKQKELSVYGTFLQGQSINETQFEQAGILVIGNESRGISSEIEAYISQKITIPAFAHHSTKQGKAESLNAAVATAIIAATIRK